VAASQATHARHAVRAGGIAAALLTAKTLALAVHGVTPGALDLLALGWQDALVALVFWAADALLRRPRWLWIPYVAMIAYIAVNAAVVHTLGAPLTITMIRAAGGALADSIGAALTAGAAISIALIVAAGAAGPRLASMLPRALRVLAVCAGVLVVIAGSLTSRAIESGGLGRNAFTSLTATFAARVVAAPSTMDHRASPFGDRSGEGMAELRGLAAGRNVLLVGLESTAARYLAPYGAPDDPTPAVTALARESIVFDAAYAAYPESVKGLFAVLCAAAPAIDVEAEAHANAPCDSVVHRVARAGYRTALLHAGRFTYLGMQPVMDMHRFDGTFDAAAISGRVQSSFGVDEPAVVEKLLAWIDDEPRGKPFFAVYLPAAGHHPYLSNGGPFSGDTDLGAYKNAIHEGDRALGTLVDGLRRRGLLDQTLIVIYGDHGEAFDQHPGNRAHSLYIYDENVRVPLIIRVPGTPAGAVRRVPQVASVIDIGPTIVDLLGLPGEATAQGSSLLRSRERMALFHADYASGWLGLRDRCWKYVYEIDTARGRLYDVCLDPDETRDLASDHRARVETYRDHLLNWSAARRHAIVGK
jgi:glucan phosphoethanolaminetransferase (alkaline phosphatase superfamily)